MTLCNYRFLVFKDSGHIPRINEGAKIPDKQKYIEIEIIWKCYIQYHKSSAYNLVFVMQ